MRRNQFAVRVLLLFLFLPVFAAAMPSGRGGHRPGEAPAVADSQQVFFTPEEEAALARALARDGDDNPGPTLAEIGAFEEGDERAERHEVAQSWRSYVFPAIMKIVIYGVGLVLLAGIGLWLGALLFSARKMRRQNRLLSQPSNGLVMDPEPPPVDPAFGWGPAPGGIDPRLARRCTIKGIPIVVYPRFIPQFPQPRRGKRPPKR